MIDDQGNPLMNAEEEYLLWNNLLVDATAFESWLTFRSDNKLEASTEEFHCYATKLEEENDLSILKEGQLLFCMCSAALMNDSSVRNRAEDFGSAWHSKKNSRSRPSVAHYMCPSAIRPAWLLC